MVSTNDTEATATAAGAASSNTTSPLPMSPSNNTNKDPLLAQEELPSFPSESIENLKQNGSSAQKVPLNGNGHFPEMTTTSANDDAAAAFHTEDTTAVVVTTSAAPNDNAPPSPPAAAATDGDQQQWGDNNNHDVSSTTAMEETTTASSTTVMASSSLVVLEEQQLVVSSSPQSTTFKQIIAEEQEQEGEQQQQQQEEKQPAIPSRPKVSDKSPRKENDWLRSPTSIGDGYTKIVREMGKLRQFLLVANSNNNNSNSKNTDNTTSGADEKSPDPSASNAADSAAALGAAGATSSPSGNGNSSVIEKLGMWINGAKSPPSSQTTTTTTTDNNSNNNEEEANHESQHQQQQQQEIVQEEEDTEKQVQQRLEIIEQHAKSLMTSQRSGFLNTNYDLPMLVLKELDLIKSLLDQCWNTTTNHDVVMNDRSYSVGTDDTNHNDGADVGYDEKKNELEQAKETYESIKSFSMELESKLEQEIQKVMDNRKVKITEGQGPPLPPPPPPSAATDGIGEGESSLEQQQPTSTSTTTADVSTEVQKKKRKRVGAKCLSKVRRSWEMSNGISGGATTTTTTSTTTRRRVQFLSSSSTSRGGGGGDYGTTTTTNFRNRKTYDKSLSEIIANIPDNDDDDDVTNGSLTTNTNGMMIMMKKGSSHVVSYESINGVIPTMAPPMLDGQPAIPPDYAAAFGKKRKRGLRDSSGSTAFSIDGGGGKGGTASSSSQTKNKRFRRNDSSVSRTSAAAAAGEGGGAAFPSSSTTKESSTSTTNLHVRILPDTTPRPKVAFVEGDTNPNRLTNPLLRLPQFPDGLDPPIEEIPQGGELWSLADLHWHDPDTYPISYLARLLGFDVPEEGVDEPFAEKFDPMTVKMMKDDTDPWACVPDCGSFIDRVWKQEDTAEGTGKCDDLNLSYCDPLWANIISSYRGFNEGDFKDAGKGFTDDLLPDCLNFAQERGILSKEKGVSFRFGTPKDEELLQPLADKCSWKSHQKHDLATSLRGQSSFCIIAQSADSGVIAFIQYSFCWYRVEEKISAASGAEKVSELVVFLDALVYDSNMGAVTEGSSRISHDDLECVKTLLTSLALIHAARANIWYGMVDSPQPLVQFFTKYFRMSTIGREIVGAVPLVFDLKKCHFRYAILLLEETLKMKESKKSDLKHEGAGERMIVRLPANAFELRSNISSASKDSRSKKARIRLVQDGSKTEMFSVSANTAEEEESLTIVDPNSFDANTPTQWNVLRLFPLGDKRSLKDGTSASPTDGFLDELEKKQRELANLEASIEVTARGLLTKAYEETSEFHRNGSAAKRQQDEKTLDEYAAVQKRLHEADLAWQAQLDQDMDAVCDICFDGEVTPENQIIFCDTCNVAVHQGCYGIDKVPSGNYFCRACTHFDIDKEFLAAERRRGPRTKPTRPHINCELCPRRHGAFVLVDSPEPADLEPTNKPKKAKWVHVSCAKWHGMNYVDIELKDKIEDVTVLKNWFKDAGHKCCLCGSGVGAMHQCRHEGCGEWLHLTCGRSIGTCSVQHGENCFGFYDETKLKNPPWTLACPNHSEVDPESIREDSLTIEQLVTIANSYPPEPVPPKPFYKMNGAERKEYWADKDNLNDFFRKVTSNLSGAKCDICEIAHDPNDTNKSNQFCPECGAFSHSECADPDRREDGICYRCRFVAKNKNSDDYVEPQCHMCNTSTLVGGPLVKTYAKPLTMKKWTNNKAAFKRSLYGPNNFCHTLCGLWNNKCTSLDGGQVIDCFNIIMSDGRRHVTHQFRCFLCGKSNGAKVHCVEEGCVAPGGTKIPYFHVTCARQAGLEVSSDPDFVLACFHHADSSHVFRARLEDFVEIEIMRYSEKAQMKNVLKISSPMSWDHASKLFHSAVIVLRTLGWAWRWAEWWVASGDNWEPLIRDDQNEAKMTDKELKKVESTPESRCNDARRSRLAALGAALRNRDYDKIEGDDQEPLERALMAVMSIPSLVGPLKQKEKEFYVTWLSLAYRSATPKLGFGDHKTPVASDSYCVHQADGSPKFELGSRPLPGKTPPEKENGFFEPLVDEPDDFLKEPTSGSPIRKKRLRQSA